MKQLLVFGLLLCLFSCSDEEATGVMKEPPVIEEPTEDIITEYVLDSELCTDLWRPAGTVYYNLTRNEVSFAEPVAGTEVFSLQPELLVVPIDEDDTFGPTSFDVYTTLFVEFSNDTLFIQTDILGLETFQSCKSHYVEM